MQSTQSMFDRAMSRKGSLAIFMPPVIPTKLETDNRGLLPTRVIEMTMQPQTTSARRQAGSVPRAILMSAILGLLFVVTTHSPEVSAAAKSVGKVLFAKGVNTADSRGEGTRFLGKGSELFEGDTLTTSGRSYAIIEMKDKGKMTLRPNTVFRIESYKYDATSTKPEKNNAILRLFRGGLRAVTGLIGKRNPRSGMKLISPVATLGIRGTEFDTRLCESDCGQEAAALKAKKQRRPRVIGRVAFARGSIKGYGRDGSERPILSGATLYRGDELETMAGASAVVVFRDQTRVTVRPKTRFKVQQYRFRKKAPEKNQTVFRLLRGGLRVVTGLIGKQNYKRFKINTPVATIGIRGTNFDLRCEGACAEADPKAIKNQLSQSRFDLKSLLASALSFLVKPVEAQAPFSMGQNLVLYTRQGETNMQLPGQKPFKVPAGKVAAFKIGGGGAKGPRLLPNVPTQMKNDPTQKPETVKPKTKQRFGTKKVDPKQPGQFTTVSKGNVNQQQGKQPPVNIGKGESGFTGKSGGKSVRLNRIPKFINQDNTPKPQQYDPKVNKTLSLSDQDTSDPGESKGKSCAIN